jgi:3-oxoadipate enol-lactonase/4-carboxymuconolactone decarboxylase
VSRPRLIGTVTAVRRDVAAAELVVLGPSLGTTTALWDAVANDLAADFRVLRFDLPGHGASPSATESFSVGDLADAVVDLVDSVGGGAFAYAGISLGGAIGLELATRFPHRLTSLAVICAAAQFGTTEGWLDRAARARTSGTASLVALSTERWFAPGFLEAHAAEGGAALSRLVDVDDESYALCCEALAVFDARDRARIIRVPTLCVAGQFDSAVPPERVKQLAELIPAGALVILPGAAHLPAMDHPAEVAALVRTQIGGMRVRREVLGDRRFSGLHHAVCLGGDLDPARACPQGPQPAHPRRADHRRAQP